MLEISYKLQSIQDTYTIFKQLIGITSVHRHKVDRTFIIDIQTISMIKTVVSNFKVFILGKS